MGRDAAGSGPGGKGTDRGAALPFWQTKTLEEMTPSEWDALCDRCGWCCVIKWIDPETEEVCHSRVACRLLDLETCRCRHYRDRRRYVPDCVRLTPARVRRMNWLPWNCAYRRLKEGRGLPRWHPLVTGDPESVHRTGRSARGRLTSEADPPLEEPQDRLGSPALRSSGPLSDRKM